MLTIGHHTYSHPIFNNLNNTQIEQEIQKSNDFFKNNFGFIPKHFAYPFGGRMEVSQKHFYLIKNLGFKSAVTTRHGSIFDDHKNHLHALPRIFLNNDFKLESIFNFRKQRIVTN